RPDSYRLEPRDSDEGEGAAPEPPHKHNPKLPRDLEVICLKCLEKNPRRRYSSALVLADDLRAWLENRLIAARPAVAIERAAFLVRQTVNRFLKPDMMAYPIDPRES